MSNMKLNKFSADDWFAFQGTEEAKHRPALIAHGKNITVIVDMNQGIYACDSEYQRHFNLNVDGYKNKILIASNLHEEVTIEKLINLGWTES